MQKFLIDWKENKDYVDFLKLMGSLSRVFSDNDIPFIHYRVTENLFCKCYGAKNLSRDDSAYDAMVDNCLGVGIKTFQIVNGNVSLEKIAEFNKLAPNLSPLKGVDLAVEVSKLRNKRINVANELYNTNNRFYHIIGRVDGGLRIFNSHYNIIDIENIRDVKTKDAGITFNDGKDEYNFNRSKSTLLKKFIVPSSVLDIPIEIINDPYELLKHLITSNIVETEYSPLVLGKDYVVLPLYNVARNEVPQKSGLNQWNADGRRRDPNEIYITIPAKVKRQYPNFFPTRNEIFNLILPDGKELKAKICQDGDKALMSNPNKDLGEWLLRKVMNVAKWQLVTMKNLAEVGFDCVIITKRDDLHYAINVNSIDKYDQYL